MKNNEISDSRRNFFKKIFTASILAAACPHILLGEITPDVKIESGTIELKYLVDFDLYPDLKTLWGSVYFKCQTITDEFMHFIIAHIDKNLYGTEYVVLSEFCPHEGHQVYLLNENIVPNKPSYYTYTCSGHGTIFYPDGKFKEGPAAKDLLKYKLEYSGGNSLNVVLTFVGVAEDNPAVTFISECSPNPAFDFCHVDFGFNSRVNADISLFDTHGSMVKRISSKEYYEGKYSETIDLRGLSQGMYLLKLSINGRTAIVRKISVIR